VCDDLEAGEYIVSLLGETIPKTYLPILVFIVSALTAFSTGTSWGTMAILIPTVTPLAVELAGGEYGVFVSLSLAAILDGAIMGDHCSPISDTTIMSSISTDCNLLNHVKTQLPYSLIVGVLALCIGYWPATMGFSLAISFPVALFLIVILFFGLKSFKKRGGSPL
jgi:Na+/H+ antiporter NhaC